MEAAWRRAAPRSMNGQRCQTRLKASSRASLRCLAGVARRHASATMTWLSCSSAEQTTGRAHARRSWCARTSRAPTSGCSRPRRRSRPRRWRGAARRFSTSLICPTRTTMKLSDLRAELKEATAPERPCTFCMWEGRMMKATHVVRNEHDMECFTCGHADHFNALHTYIPIVKWFQDAGVIIMDGETHYTD